MGFQFLTAWKKVLLLDVLIEQCQDRPELLRTTYHLSVETFQDVFLMRFL